MKVETAMQRANIKSGYVFSQPQIDLKLALHPWVYMSYVG